MSELPDWARRLDLSPHPEGGWFRETWRSDLTVPQSALPPGLHRPTQRGNGDPVPAHARPAVGMAHGAQRRAVALSLRQSAAASGRTRAGRCHNASARCRHRRRRAPAARRAAGTLAAGTSPRRRTQPGQLCRGTRLRLRRLRAGSRLPTEQFDRCGHQRCVVRRVEPSGSASVSSIRCGSARRVARRVRSSGQQLSSRPCSSTGAGEPAAITWLSRSSAVAMSPSACSSIMTRMQCWRYLRRRPRRGRLGVEDPDLDAESLAQQQSGEVLGDPARASSPRRSRAAPLHRLTARSRCVGDRAAPRTPSSRRRAARAPRGAPRTPLRRRRPAAASPRRRRSWDACAPPWRRPDGRPAPRRPVARGDRQIRVLIGGAGAVDARLDVDLGGGDHPSIFACRSLSSTRRSRLVGLPAPRSRTANLTVSVSTGLGVRSRKHVAASAAPTRFWITRTTSTTRVVGPTRARTSSPGDTVVAGFAGRPLTRTWPPRHASAASGRVFTSRTDHSHLSTRVDSTPSIMAHQVAVEMQRRLTGHAWLL